LVVYLGTGTTGGATTSFTCSTFDPERGDLDRSDWVSPTTEGTAAADDSSPELSSESSSARAQKREPFAVLMNADRISDDEPTLELAQLSTATTSLSVLAVEPA
jgi:hypothetical protein